MIAAAVACRAAQTLDSRVSNKYELAAWDSEAPDGKQMVSTLLHKSGEIQLSWDQGPNTVFQHGKMPSFAPRQVPVPCIAGLLSSFEESSLC